MAYNRKKTLASIYRRLYRRFGSQHWWPGETPFEVMVAAILTQNTSWQNVEKAIRRLKKAGLLTPKKLNALDKRKLAAYIHSAGYFNVKALRLKNFLKLFVGNYAGSVKKMSSRDTQGLREELLSVNGIGPETADSILLYALNKPVFVVDAYTRRILSRHGLTGPDAPYQEIQNFFMKNAKNEVKLYNEYHALLVKLGKDFCLKSAPKCALCPLGDLKKTG